MRRLKHKIIFVAIIAIPQIFPCMAQALTNHGAVAEYEHLMINALNRLPTVPVHTTLIITNSLGNSTVRGTVDIDPIDRKMESDFVASGPYQPTMTIKNIEIDGTGYSYLNGKLMETRPYPFRIPTKGDILASYIQDVREIKSVTFDGKELKGLYGVVEKNGVEKFESTVSGLSVGQILQRGGPIIQRMVFRIYFNPTTDHIHIIKLVEDCVQSGHAYQVNETEKIYYGKALHIAAP